MLDDICISMGIFSYPFWYGHDAGTYDENMFLACVWVGGT